MLRSLPVPDSLPRFADIGVQPSRRRRGATVVEFAVIAPLFFMFVLGMIEVGRAAMVGHLLSNAAREGCRTAIVGDRNSDDVRNTVITLLASQGIRGEAVSVQVNDRTADASSAVAGNEVTVTVSVPVGQITWLPGGKFLRGSISATYTLRQE